MTDRHVRRDGDDYAEAMTALLPTGPAWPRNPDSLLGKIIAGLTVEWGRVDSRAADLLEIETDPRATTELLPEWERAFGLPDPCVEEPLTIADRQIALVEKMTTLGGQSRAYFIDLAEKLGYTITEIGEFSPFMVGISEVGDTRPTAGSPSIDYRWWIGAPEMRFYWTVAVSDVRLTWFRTGGGGGQTGIDPFLRISIASDLECVFRQRKPAHTEIIFDYSGVLRWTLPPGRQVTSLPRSGRRASHTGFAQRMKL